MAFLILVSKIKRHGWRKSFSLGARKVYQLSKGFCWRRRVQAGTAQHDWQKIARKHRVISSFNDYKTNFTIKFSRSSVSSLFDQDQKIILQTAEKLLHNYGGFLGNQKITDAQPPWYSDTRLLEMDPAADYYFDQYSFYRDIQIMSNPHGELKKDIKLPWELSRCQHLVVWAQAYHVTNDKRFLGAIETHLDDWLEHNHFMRGINWLCPMEVALRALNWLWVLHFVPAILSEKIVCSLYDHLIFLEQNWEIYDGRTNNHYFSNLVGYVYLCFFFKELPGMHQKIVWCQQELNKELDKQIFVEGTSYEGSTTYHQLMTELVQHAIILFAESNLTISAEWHKRLQRMFAFIQSCTPHKGTMITIGDNDSGKVLFWPLAINTEIASQPAFKIYREFGLSVYTSDRLHVALRQHAYHNKQPSGHFHNDVGSITLAVKGIALFVDPGSYVYTASGAWRNYFRSVEVHNTIYIKGHEPMPFDDRLFGLAMPENAPEPCLQSTNNLYTRFGLQSNRQVNISEKSIIITDWWSGINLQYSADMQSAWNFTLAPEIDVHYEGSEVKFLYQGMLLAILRSELSFSIIDGWYSPEYGVKVPCKRLQAQSELVVDKCYTIEISLYS